MIWYQGEGNTAAPASYQKLFASMITEWRSLWYKLLPFYFVQLAPFYYGIKDVGALIQEAQLETAGQEHTGLVVIADLDSDTLDIRPKKSGMWG